MVRFIFRPLGRVAAYLAGEYLAETVAGAVGVGAVVSIVLTAFFGGLRELELWQQIVFILGWMAIARVMMWMVMPSLVRLRASSRAEAFAIADRVRLAVSGDLFFHAPRLTVIDAKWTLGEVQNLLQLELRLYNPTLFDLEIDASFEGAIEYAGQPLAPPTLGGRWPGGPDSYARVIITQPFSESTIAKMNSESDGPVLNLKPLRIFTRHWLEGTDIERRAALQLPPELHLSPPASLRTNTVRGPSERLELVWGKA